MPINNTLLQKKIAHDYSVYAFTTYCILAASGSTVDPV